jgi:hypothetical protein
MDRLRVQAVPAWEAGISLLRRRTDRIDAYRALPASGSSAVFCTERSSIRIMVCALCASERIYPHCCKYTRETPNLGTYQHSIRLHQRRNSQQVALQTQSQGRRGIDNGMTCFGDIDVENLLAVDALQAGLCAESCNEPAAWLVLGRRYLVPSVLTRLWPRHICAT